MGGLSQATFKISGGTGVFNGTCKIVPSLQAPGFSSAVREDAPPRQLSRYQQVQRIRISRPLDDTNIQRLQGRVRHEARQELEPLHARSGHLKPISRSAGARANKPCSCPSRTSPGDRSPYTGDATRKTRSARPATTACGEGDLEQLSLCEGFGGTDGAGAPGGGRRKATSIWR